MRGGQCGLTRSELGVGAASIFTGLRVDSKSASLYWAPKVRGERTLHLLYVVCESVSLGNFSTPTAGGPSPGLRFSS